MKLSIQLLSVLSATACLSSAEATPVTFLIDGGTSAQITCPADDFCYVKNHKDIPSSNEATIETISPGSTLESWTTNVQDAAKQFRFLSDSSQMVTVKATFPEDAEGIFYCNAQCTCTNENGSSCAAARTARDEPTTGPTWSDRKPELPNTCPMNGGDSFVGPTRLDKACPEVMRALPLEMKCDCGYIFNIGTGLLDRCQTSDELMLAINAADSFGLCYDEERFFEPATANSFASESPPVTDSPGSSPTEALDSPTEAPTFLRTTGAPSSGAATNLSFAALTLTGTVVFLFDTLLRN